MKILILLFITLFYLHAQDLIKPSNYQDQNVTGWIMSEKLDGIRGYYDGKNLYTKNGKKINTPKWFLKEFPTFELDGELWKDRDSFEEIQSIIMDDIPSDSWKSITYYVFELPNQKGDYYKRIKVLKDYISKHPNAPIKIVPQYKVISKDALTKFYNDIIEKKGEGVIVKDPNKLYHTGRSTSIYKIKPSFDMEGIVVNRNFNKDGSFKSLVVKLDNNITFNLGNGFSDKQRQNPPKIDDKVTFKYYGFTKNGKPKFASFLRIRKD